MRAASPKDVLCWMLAATGCVVACSNGAPSLPRGTAGEPTSAGGAGARGHAESGGGGGSGSGSGQAGAAAECVVESCENHVCGSLSGRGSCAAPLRLIDPAALVTGWAERMVTGDTRCGVPPAKSAACNSDGPATVFEIELSRAAELIAEVDAGFDPSLRLEHGECIDAVQLACNEDHAPGVERAVLAHSAAPGRYRLIVGGEGPADAGEFRMRVTAREPAARCLAAPPNDECDGAIDLDPELSVQTAVGRTHCARDDGNAFFYCAGEEVAEVFYRLDLRARESNVVLHASTDHPPTNAQTSLYLMDSAGGSCFAPIACGEYAPSRTQELEYAAELVADLEPGEYYLAVEALHEPVDFGLRVSLDETRCTANDQCEGALELNAAYGEQSVELDFSCAKPSRTMSCDISFDPDVFLRLDLSGFESPLQVRAAISDHWDASFALLAAQADESCGVELGCAEDELEMVLEPNLYYLLVRVGAGGPHRVELLLDLAPEPEQ